MALRTLLKLRHGVGVGTAAQIADLAIRESVNYRDLFYEPLPPDVFEGRRERTLTAARDVCAELLNWGPERTVAERADDLDRVIEMILGTDSDTDWRDEVDAVPEESTLQELAQYLAVEKDDERAEVLATIYARLGQELTPEQALPERVRVMTMHGAKGLSATMVFIPGMEEQILPSANRARYPGRCSKPPRMLYVSITRARLGCIISYATDRFIHGQATPHTASRYTTHLGRAFRDGGDGGDSLQVND